MLYKLNQVQDIIDECDGSKESELCSNCPCTDYGTENPYSSHPHWGFVSCEGSHCKEAEDNVEDNLIDEHQTRKEELGMSDAKMNVEIDLSVLEQNLVKMTTDKIEQEVVSSLTNRLSSKLEGIVEEKINKLVEEKVVALTQEDIYDVKVVADEKEISLFDYLVKKLISKAIDKSIKFDETIDKITESIEYVPVDSEFKEDEFKVLTTFTQGNWGQTDSIVVSVNGKEVFEMYDGEPEDMTLSKDLSDALRVPELIKKAYLAGKSGAIMYEATEDVN